MYKFDTNQLKIIDRVIKDTVEALYKLEPLCSVQWSSHEMFDDEDQQGIAYVFEIAGISRVDKRHNAINLLRGLAEAYGNPHRSWLKSRVNGIYGSRSPNNESGTFYVWCVVHHSTKKLGNIQPFNNMFNEFDEKNSF